MKKEYICQYCGDWANTRDHIIPISYLSNLKREKTGREFEHDENLVECCSECNCIAGSLVFDSFEEKREYIQSRLEYKYKRVINAPIWKDDEIKEMGWKFKNELRLTQMAKKWIINRINYPYVIYEEQLNTNAIKEIIKIYGQD